jgi:hypothetical protein
LTLEQLKTFHTFKHLLDESDAKLLGDLTEQVCGTEPGSQSQTEEAEHASTARLAKKSASSLPAAKAEPSDAELLAKLFV